MTCSESAQYKDKPSFSCRVASTMSAPPRIQSFLFLLCARKWLNSPIRDSQTRPQAGQVLLSSPLSMMGLGFLRLSCSSPLLCQFPPPGFEMRHPVRYGGSPGSSVDSIISQFSTLIPKLFRDCFRVSLYRLR